MEVLQGVYALVLVLGLGNGALGFTAQRVRSFTFACSSQRWCFSRGCSLLITMLRSIFELDNFGARVVQEDSMCLPSSSSETPCSYQVDRESLSQ